MFTINYFLSNVLLDKMDITGKYKSESMGNIKLRGKVKELELYSIGKINY